MNQTLRMRFFPLLLAASLLAPSACKKKQAAEEEAPIEHVGSSPLGTSQVVLHKDFAVRTTVAFPFEMPAHAAMPHLRGTYKSFVTKLGVQPNPDGANVDFLVFTEDQYANFAQGVTGNSLFSVDSSHDQTVDVGLPPSLNEPRKFYLVFRSTPGGDARKVVKADLSVDF
jgi:hypothetical protein